MFLKKFYFGLAASILGAGDLDNYQRPPLLVTILAAIFALASLGFAIVILVIILSLVRP